MATLADNVYELVQRMRRVETRQAKYLASIGFESGTRMPLWFDDGVVEIPSRATSLADILSVVPEDWDRDYEITVLFNGQVMGAVLRP